MTCSHLHLWDKGQLKYSEESRVPEFLLNDREGHCPYYTCQLRLRDTVESASKINQSTKYTEKYYVIE